jgi:metal-responsive CopG/Arc/MetJ family transcriptional regulator
VWLLVDIDESRIDTAPKRVNISLPQRLLTEIDAYAQAHSATRSGFLAEAARGSNAPLKNK